MRYRGYSNEGIIQSTGLNKVAKVRCVKSWNKFGMNSVEEHRGGKTPPKLSLDIVDDLIYVVLNKSPNDFEFIGHTWTFQLLSISNVLGLNHYSKVLI